MRALSSSFAPLCSLFALIATAVPGFAQKMELCNHRTASIGAVAIPIFDEALSNPSPRLDLVLSETGNILSAGGVDPIPQGAIPPLYEALARCEIRPAMSCDEMVKSLLGFTVNRYLYRVDERPLPDGLRMATIFEEGFFTDLEFLYFSRGGVCEVVLTLDENGQVTEIEGLDKNSRKAADVIFEPIQDTLRFEAKMGSEIPEGYKLRLVIDFSGKEIPEEPEEADSRSMPKMPEGITLESVKNVQLIVTYEDTGLPAQIQILESDESLLEIPALMAVRKWRLNTEENPNREYFVDLDFLPDGTVELAVEPRGIQLTPPEFEATAMPKYPVGLKKAGVEGSVWLDYTVTKEGKVTNVTARATNEEFIKPTLAAFARWKFEPGKVEGKDASFQVRQQIFFSRQP